MSQEISVDDLKEKFEADTQTLFKLINTFGTPLSEGDIRLASTILRRWLCEGAINHLARNLGAVPTFAVLDNADALQAVGSDARVNYFLTGGVMLSGTPVSCIYNSSAPPSEPLPLKRPEHVMVKTGKFLQQKRVFFEGHHFTAEDIILFMANKLGGVHFDNRLDAKQQQMQRASEFMTFGGPIEKLGREPPGKLHLTIESDSTSVLSGFHLEIIAAASSLIQVHLDGEPVALMPEMRKTWFARLFGTKRFQFELSGKGL